VRFARSVFLLAGIYGVAVLTPGFFVSTNSGKESTRLLHMEFYYGFFGVALTWQIVYFLISKDPLRYRPMMLAAALAKLSFFGACMVLFYSGRLMPGGALYASLVDAGLAILFVISFARLPAYAPAWSTEQVGPQRQP